MLTRWQTGLIGLALVAVVGVAPAASAGPLTLRFSDDVGNVLTAEDEGAGDIAPGVPGAVAIFQVFVPGTSTFVLTVGESNPYRPPPYPHLNLSVNLFNSVVGGTFTIELSQTGFTDPAAALAFAASFDGFLGADPGSTWAIEVFVDPADVLFSTGGTQIVGAGGGPTVFAGTGAALAPVDGSYSVTLRMVANLASDGTFNANATVQVPEPATLALFGLGLLGLGAASRYSRRAGATGSPGRRRSVVRGHTGMRGQSA